MRILGIHDGHDSGAAIIKDGVIEAAINEERLTRIKNEPRFPHLSIQKVLEMVGTDISKIDYIAVPSAPLEMASRRAGFQIPRGYKKLLGPAIYLYMRAYFWKKHLRGIEKKIRESTGFDGSIKFIDHHQAHAASTYYTSGFKDALIVTADSGGDLLSSTISVAKNYEIKRIHANDDTGSIGKVWGRVTTICGMKYCRHEGKLLGLAAYREPSPRQLAKMRQLMRLNNLTVKIGISTGFPNLKSLRVLDFEKEVRDYYNYFKGDSPRDISPALQTVSEEVVRDLVANAVKKTGVRDVAVAGGIFANVKINQRIHDLPGVDHIYVHPNMGDGGLAAGAALQVWADDMLNRGREPRPYKMEHSYLGPGYTNDEIENAIDAFKVDSTKVKDAGKATGELIAEKKVIAFHQGKMEYGPRALGNRSILYHPTDKKVNDWLNVRLKRTEFMPFAPVTMEERAGECYKRYNKSPHSAKFMTITYDCTDYMAKTQEAVVHIDGAVRPQIINRQITKPYYDPLKTYEGISGLPTVINTSFNMHEEPIVCSPFDSIRAYLASKIDALVIGDHVLVAK